MGEAVGFVVVVGGVVVVVGVVGIAFEVVSGMIGQSLASPLPMVTANRQTHNECSTLQFNEK